MSNDESPAIAFSPRQSRQPGSSRRLFRLSAIAALVGLGGCLSQPLQKTEGIHSTGGLACSVGTCVPVVVPPQVVEAGGLKRISFATDRSPISAQVASQLEVQLSKVRVNDAPFYKVVPSADPTRQAVYEISANVSPVTSERSVEERTRCADSSSMKDMLKCKSPTKYRVSCVSRKVTLDTTTRIRRQSGELLATRQHSGAGEQKFCQGDNGAPDSDDVLRGAALAKVTRSMQESLAVTVKMAPVRTKDDTSGIRDAGRQQRFRDALVWHKTGRLDRSCPVFEELAEIESQSVAVFYNSAFCSQAGGDWRKAYQLYQQADRLTKSPDSDIAAALKETALAATQAKL